MSSTIGLLRVLTEDGYLSFDRANWTYAPTGRIPDLGARIGTTFFEDQRLFDLMAAVQKATGEFVAIGAATDIYIDYIRSLRSTEQIQYYSPAGTRYLMVQSGMGWLLLSRMETAAVTRIYRRTVAAGQLDPAAFSEAELLRRVEALEGADCVLTHASDYVAGTGHSGGAMILSIVPQVSAHRPLVIGVGGPEDRLEQKRTMVIGTMRTELERFSAQYSTV